MKRTKHWSIKIQYIFLYILVAIILYNLYNGYKERVLVQNNYAFTYGKIVYCSVGGDASSVRMIYEYKVDNVFYNKTILRLKSKYEICCKDIRYCSDKRFWVAYSMKKPNKSMINLFKEIQNEKEPKPPVNLDNFD